MQVSPAELAGLLEAGSVKILDVRTREEFDAARIEGSIFFTQELMQEVLSRGTRRRRSSSSTTRAFAAWMQPLFSRTMDFRTSAAWPAASTHGAWR